MQMTRNVQSMIIADYVQFTEKKEENTGRYISLSISTELFASKGAALLELAVNRFNSGAVLMVSRKLGKPL